MSTDPRARRILLILIGETLREEHPDNPFTEDDRIRLCRSASTRTGVTTEELLHATPRVTEPTTRGAYGTALLEAMNYAS